MAINVDEAQGFEEFGWRATDDDGNVLFYLTFGTGSPVGQAAPVPTVYVQIEDASIWRKFGPTVNDWNQVAAGDDLFIGGVSASYNHIPPQCVGGGDADGN